MEDNTYGNRRVDPYKFIEDQLIEDIRYKIMNNQKFNLGIEEYIDHTKPYIEMGGIIYFNSRHPLNEGAENLKQSCNIKEFYKVMSDPLDRGSTLLAKELLKNKSNSKNSNIFRKILKLFKW